MKKIILTLMFLVLTSITSHAKMPEKMVGENFQRVENLIDCQTFWTDALAPSHKEVKKTLCFYDVYYIKDSQEVHFVMIVSDNQVEFMNAK